MKDTYDVAIIGGGVLGTFHAYFALRNGLKVALFEKNGRPMGASVRNFGQVVPSGMNSKWQAYGRESLKTYKRIQEEFDITVKQNGSVYLASDEEEERLLVELREINLQNNYRSMMLTKNQCLERYPGLRSDYVRAGLFFPEEVTIEPKTMVQKLHAYLKAGGLQLFYHTKIVECNVLLKEVKLHSIRNETFSAKKVIVCNGSDFENLYPQLFEESDLEVSKLQMMQTVPQPDYRLKGSVLTGWSIRRYEAFSECPSFTEIKKKELADSPQRKWGVHILFKQAVNGSIILGDSHEYADVGRLDELGFDRQEGIDAFVLDEAKKIFDLPTYKIQNRWLGYYSQCKTADIYQKELEGHVHIVTGIGGKGMTASAGFAERHIEQLFNF